MVCGWEADEGLSVIVHLFDFEVVVLVHCITLLDL